MTITRTPLKGGLKNIHSSLLDGYQPFSTATVSVLAHNQDLIHTTYQPRHLVNDWYPAGLSRYWYANVGTMLGCWGAFNYQEDMKLIVRVNLSASDSPVLYAASTVDPPDLDGYNALKTRLENSVYWDSATVSSAVTHWETLELEPNPSKWFWISLWAQAVSGCNMTIRSISILEKRRYGYG